MLQGTSIDSTLTLLLSKMDKMESNIANVTKTNNLLQERITAQEQNNVSRHPDSSEYQGDDLDEEGKPSSEELRPVNTEICLTVGKVVRDQAEAMSIGKYSLVDGLFNQKFPVPKTSGHLSSHSPSQGIKAPHSTRSKRKLDDKNDLNVGNETINQIVAENESPEAYGVPVLENLNSAVTKFWKTEARNEQKIKKLKNEYLLAISCPKLYVPTLNEEITKNKNIYHYYKRNDKRWFDLQNIVLKATSAVVEITNLCLEGDSKNEVIHSKDVVVKAVDVITLLDKANHKMTFERKEKLKNALPEDYKTICEQDHSDSKQLLGGDLADNVKKSKTTHSMNQSISNKRLGLFSSSPRNPTSLYSSSSNASTSVTHSLNFHGRKKNFQYPQPTTRWNQKQ